MKKHLFLFAAAAVALASCSSDDTIAENSSVGSNQQKEITFFPLNQVSTRTSDVSSHSIEGATFPTTLDMMVQAYDQTLGKDFFPAATNFEYISNIVNGNPTKNYWHGETPRYWPLSAANINFFAIANANDDNATSVTWDPSSVSAKAAAVKIVMQDNYGKTKQRDLLYGAGNGKVTQDGNNLGFPAYVPITFKHAQSYLVFNLKTAADYSASGATISIKNIELAGVRTKGDATITNTNCKTGDSGTGATTLQWTDPESDTPYPGGDAAETYHSITYNPSPSTEVQGVFDPVIALTTSYKELGHLIVVPKMSDVDTYADNGTTKLKISYQMYGNDYTYEYEIDNDTYEAGKKYIYNITFTLHEIYMEPVVTEWVEVEKAIGLPVVSYANTNAGAFDYPESGKIAAASGTYTFDVTGLSSTTDVTVEEGTGGTGTLSSFSHVYDTTSKIATVTFTVPASGGSEKTYKIKVTDNGTSGSTYVNTITITQKATD